jgi:hypothetical protein
MVHQKFFSFSHRRMLGFDYNIIPHVLVIDGENAIQIQMEAAGYSTLLIGGH